jgi:hypothetical protein
VGCVI